jgi:hypothetical protein
MSIARSNVTGICIPKFRLGSMAVTRGASDAFIRSGDNVGALIVRHVDGDWGDLDDYDASQNDEAVTRDLRILSSYVLSTGEKVWIITEGDRSRTTILTPDEY